MRIIPGHKNLFLVPDLGSTHARFFDPTSYTCECLFYCFINYQFHIRNLNANEINAAKFNYSLLTCK